MQISIAAGLLILLAAASISRNAQWQNDAAIWGSTLKTFPNKARGYNEVGLYLLEQGDYEKAYQYLNRSLELNPYQQPIWNNLARASERLGRIEEAVRIYERAIGNAPQDAVPYYNLGVLYHDRLNRPDKALSCLLRARDLDPLEPDVHYELSRLYAELGDGERSRDELARFNYLKR